MTPMGERTEKQAEGGGNKMIILLLSMYGVGIKNKLICWSKRATHVFAKHGASMVLMAIKMISIFLHLFFNLITN